jgi:hypothetical protein
VLYLTASRRKRKWVKELIEQSWREELWAPQTEERLLLAVVRLGTLLFFLVWCLFL